MHVPPPARPQALALEHSCTFNALGLVALGRMGALRELRLHVDDWCCGAASYSVYGDTSSMARKRERLRQQLEACAGCGSSDGGSSSTPSSGDLLRLYDTMRLGCMECNTNGVAGFPSFELSQGQKELVLALTALSVLVTHTQGRRSQLQSVSVDPVAALRWRPSEHLSREQKENSPRWQCVGAALVAAVRDRAVSLGGNKWLVVCV
jgi:hypothetical protein